MGKTKFLLFIANIYSCWCFLIFRLTLSHICFIKYVTVDPNDIKLKLTRTAFQFNKLIKKDN